MQERLDPATKHAYAILLRQCSSPKSLCFVKQLHSRIPTDGYDAFLSNLLIQIYGRCGSVEDAHHVFLKMPYRNVFSWNILIAVFASAGHIPDARKAFEEMPERDSVSWNTMLAAYSQEGNLREAKEIFDGTPEPNLITWNSMITAYFQNGDIVNSRRIFDSMLEKNVVSWNCMITGYVQEDDHSSAEWLFERMPEHNLTTWNLMLSSYASSGQVDSARSLFEKIPEWNLVSWNILLGAYALNGDLQEAKKIFDRISERSVATWNLMIKAYVTIDQGFMALELYGTMDLPPDEITFTSLLDACTSATDLSQGRILHSEISRKGYFADPIVANAVINMYCCCGDLATAGEIFARAPERTPVSWAEMIAAFARVGRSENAWDFFRRMSVEGFSPSEKSFVGILSACSHGGLLEDGILFFVAMIEDFAMPPLANHFVCVVDLLARAGQLSRAEDLVAAMPVIQQEGLQWKTLLGACRIQGESKLARRVARKIFDLDARTGSSYVLLSGALPTSNMPS